MWMICPELRKHFRGLHGCKSGVLDILVCPLIRIDADGIGHSLRHRSEMLVALDKGFFRDSFERRR